MSATFKYVRNKIIFYIVYIFFFIFSRTPWKLNITLGSILGKVFFYFDLRYRRVVFKNLRFIFPNIDHKKIVRITKECYSNLGKNLFEFFLFPRIKYILHKLVEIDEESIKLLKENLSQNKGLIIFSAHFGNWELLGATLASLGIPLAVIARSVYIQDLNLLVDKLRSKVGEVVISRGSEQSVKKLMYALKKGYAIGVLVDQNIKNIKNVELYFLGKVAPTPISFAEMVIKYNTPSVIGLIYRLNNGCHKVIILPVEQNLYSDKLKLMQYINQKISEYIFKHPHQWVWMHNRWNL